MAPPSQTLLNNSQSQQLVCADASAAVMGCRMMQFLSEEVSEVPLGKRRGSGAFANSEAANKRRRSLLALMTAHSKELLALVVQAASVYMQAGLQAAAEGQQATAAEAQGAVRAALEALAALAGWLPLKILNDSQVLDACSSLVHTRELQIPAIEVILQVRALHGTAWRPLAASLAGTHSPPIVWCRGSVIG